MCVSFPFCNILCNHYPFLLIHGPPPPHTHTPVLQPFCKKASAPNSDRINQQNLSSYCEETTSLNILYHTYRIKKFSKFREIVPPTCMHHLKIKIMNNIMYEIKTNSTNVFIKAPLQLYELTQANSTSYIHIMSVHRKTFFPPTYLLYQNYF